MTLTPESHNTTHKAQPDFLTFALQRRFTAQPELLVETASLRQGKGNRREMRASVLLTRIDPTRWMGLTCSPKTSPSIS